MQQTHLFENTITNSEHTEGTPNINIVMELGSCISLKQHILPSDHAVLKQHKDCEMIFSLSSTILGVIHYWWDSPDDVLH